MNQTENRFYRKAESPPTTLSEERLAEMKEQYDAIEHKVVDPSRDFYVSSDESDKLIKFWTDLHNAFPSLLHAAEQMARYEVERTSLVSAVEDAIRLINHLGGNPNFQVKVLKTLPPAPEKGGHGA